MTSKCTCTLDELKTPYHGECSECGMHLIGYREYVMCVSDTCSSTVYLEKRERPAPTPTTSELPPITPPPASVDSSRAVLDFVSLASELARLARFEAFVRGATDCPAHHDASRQDVTEWPYDCRGGDCDRGCVATCPPLCPWREHRAIPDPT